MNYFDGGLLSQGIIGVASSPPVLRYVDWRMRIHKYFPVLGTIRRILDILEVTWQRAGLCSCDNHFYLITKYHSPIVQ